MNVDNLDDSVRFYSTLFGQAPSLVKNDYAKWMLDDPRVNFSITARDCTVERVHFGIQVEDPGELTEAARRLQGAGSQVVSEKDAVCCYHRSQKAWVADPQGYLWETFLTEGEAPVYGEDNAEVSGLACCD
jgi:catechol 2,3-dioxygenase-like lactoylglutathione lyase family enzyme